jgi:hypothetical protein
MMPGVDSERLRPFLLVNIDGVLSVYDVEACPEGYEEFQLFADDPEPSLLCRAHAQWLAELARAFDLVLGISVGIPSKRAALSCSRARSAAFRSGAARPF